MKKRRREKHQARRRLGVAGSFAGVVQGGTGNVIPSKILAKNGVGDLFLGRLRVSYGR